MDPFLTNTSFDIFSSSNVSGGWVNLLLNESQRHIIRHFICLDLLSLLTCVYLFKRYVCEHPCGILGIYAVSKFERQLPITGQKATETPPHSNHSLGTKCVPNCLHLDTSPTRQNRPPPTAPPRSDRRLPILVLLALLPALACTRRLSGAVDTSRFSSSVRNGPHARQDENQ